MSNYNYTYGQKTKVPFDKQDSPCNRGIEKVLKTIGVERQAYYSGTFVVHTCLKVYVTYVVIIIIATQHRPHYIIHHRDNYDPLSAISRRL